jgi:hypothetical protein
MMTTLTPENLPPRVVEPFRSAVLAAARCWNLTLGERLVSLVLFGSVARGDAGPTSDVDILVIAAGFPRPLRDRRRPLLSAWSEWRAARALPGVNWNLVTKTPEEAAWHSPLYLDMVEDGILLCDREGFFGAVLSRMRASMKTLGSRRVYLADGSWYWNLKPDFRFGEVVEI